MEKKNIKYMLVMSSIVIALMVSSVSAVPYTQYNEIKRMTDDKIQETIDEALNSKNFQKLKNIVTPLFNEKYNETIRNQLHEPFLKEVVEKFPNLPTAPYYPEFCEFLFLVLDSMFLLLGHGVVGITSALIVVYLITLVFSVGIGLATIPYCVVLTGGIIAWTLASLLDVGGILYQFGFVGAFVVLIALLPIALLFLVIGTPILAVINMIKVFDDTILYTTNIIFP